MNAHAFGVIRPSSLSTFSWTPAHPLSCETAAAAAGVAAADTDGPAATAPKDNPAAIVAASSPVCPSVVFFVRRARCIATMAVPHS